MKERERERERERSIEGKGKRGKRHKKVLDVLQEKRGYWKLK